MNKPLKTLYEQWSETSKDTPEYTYAVRFFCDDKKITIEQSNVNNDILVDCVLAESKMAFYAGFQTAVQLLTGGVQS